MSDTERYWILDAENEHNKIAEVAQASGLKIVGLVDERAGGVIAYVVDSVADEICDRLNRGD